MWLAKQTEEEEDRMSVTSLRDRRSHSQHKRQVWRKKARLQLVRQMQASQTNYNGAGAGWKTFRKVALFLIFYICMVDLVTEFILLILIGIGEGRKACLCSYYNQGDFHKRYIKEDFNQTFKDSDGEEWICQVQGHWESCVCNERGTNAASTELLMNVSSCNFLSIAGFYLFAHGAQVVLLLILLTSMFKMSQHCPDKDRVNIEEFVIPCPASIREAFRSVHAESKNLFMFWFTVFSATLGVEIFITILYVLVQYSQGGTPLHSLAPYELPDAFVSKETIGSALHYCAVAVQVIGLYVWTMANQLFTVKPNLRAILIKRDPWDPNMDPNSQPQRVQVYNSKSDKKAGAIFANVTTWLPAAATTKPDFEVRFKLNFVDKQGLRTRPSPFMPPPKVFFTSQSGTERSTEEKTVMLKIKKSRFFGSASMVTFFVKLDAEKVLGRHELVFRQDQDPVFDPDGASAGNVEDLDAAMEEEAETLTCQELVISDPEADHAQLQVLEQRIAAVESTVAEIMPQLGPIFENIAQEKALDADRQRIHSTPYLQDYYVLVQMRIVGMTVSCSAIASGMVEDASEETGGLAGNVMASGANMIEFLADQVQVIPFSNAATALVTGGMRMYAEHQKAVRVRNCERVFYSPTQSDAVAEEVARKATIAYANTLARLDSHSRPAGGAQKKSTVKKMMEKMSDLSDMASVAYADTPVKKRAEADAEAIVEFVMSGQVTSNVSDPHAVAHELLGVLLDQSAIDQAEHVGDFGAAVAGPEPKPGTALGADDVPVAPAFKRETTEQKSLADDAKRWLQDGVQFRKSTYGGAMVYHYSLKVNRQADKLQWSRKNSHKTHFLELNETTMVDNADVREPKKVVISTAVPGAARQEETFNFADEMLAFRFRENMTLLLEHQQATRRQAAGMSTHPNDVRPPAPSDGFVTEEDASALRMPLMSAESKAEDGAVLPTPEAKSKKRGLSFTGRK